MTMMMYNLSLLIVMALLVMAASTPTPAPTASPTEHPTEQDRITGQFSPIDPKGIDAQNATKYAVSIAYPSTSTKYKVLTARVRAYLGGIYDLNVAVTFTRNKTCSVHNYLVQKAWEAWEVIPQPYSLISKTALTSQKCKCK
jgi:ribulose 1,5-bisphosphate carboxylase large subunit-like protein